MRYVRCHTVGELDLGDNFLPTAVDRPLNVIHSEELSDSQPRRFESEPPAWANTDRPIAT